MEEPKADEPVEADAPTAEAAGKEEEEERPTTTAPVEEATNNGKEEVPEELPEAKVSTEEEATPAEQQEAPPQVDAAAEDGAADPATGEPSSGAAAGDGDGAGDEKVDEGEDRPARSGKTLEQMMSLKPGDDERTVISKKLSWILRHGARKVNITFDPEGWVQIEDLVNSDIMKGVTEERLMEVIYESNKQKARYELKENDEDEVPRAIRAVNKQTISGMVGAEAREQRRRERQVRTDRPERGERGERGERAEFAESFVEEPSGPSASSRMGPSPWEYNERGQRGDYNDRGQQGNRRGAPGGVREDGPTFEQQLRDGFQPVYQGNQIVAMVKQGQTVKPGRREQGDTGRRHKGEGKGDWKGDGKGDGRGEGRSDRHKGKGDSRLDDDMMSDNRRGKGFGKGGQKGHSYGSNHYDDPNAGLPAFFTTGITQNPGRGVDLYSAIGGDRPRNGGYGSEPPRWQVCTDNELIKEAIVRATEQMESEAIASLTPGAIVTQTGKERVMPPHGIIRMPVETETGLRGWVTRTAEAANGPVFFRQLFHDNDRHAAKGYDEGGRHGGKGKGGKGKGGGKGGYADDRKGGKGRSNMGHP